MAIVDHEATGRHTTPLGSADHDPNSRDCDGHNDPVHICEPGASDRHGSERRPGLNVASTSHTESSLGAITHDAQPVTPMNAGARQAAAALWQESAATGMPLTGAQLAKHFGRSAR